MADPSKHIAIVGRLGVFPPVRLTLPARRILAFLALHTEPVSRVIASSLLWTDQPDVQARANLRRALWQCPPGWVVASGDELHVDALVDLPGARRLAARALDGGELSLDEISVLSEDLLPGWHEDWVLAPQEAFHLLRVQALESACLTMSTAGHHALATQAGTAALAAEPLRESAAAALIRAHLCEGNRYAANQRFHDFCRTLYAELGVAPNPALVAAFTSADRDKG
jgi:DNA-binding SARP family transcriptional activator